MSPDNLKNELARVDERIEKLKKDIKRGENLETLHEDVKFVDVILEGYFEDEEERLAGLLFNPTTLKREQLENIMDKATAIRNFKQYFQTLLINANVAPEQIEEEEAYRKELTSRPIDTEVVSDGGEDV